MLLKKEKIHAFKKWLRKYLQQKEKEQFEK